MKSEEFEKKFGVLIEGLRVKGWISSRWNFLIMIRWVITCVILIVVKDYSQFQIMLLFIVSVIFQGLIIAGRPNDLNIEN